MTISLIVADDGHVETIYRGQRTGEEWITLDRDRPPGPPAHVDNVSVDYWYEDGSLTVDVEPIPEDDLDL